MKKTEMTNCMADCKMFQQSVNNYPCTNCSRNENLKPKERKKARDFYMFYMKHNKK